MSNKETLHIYVRCSTDKQIENSIKRQSELGIKLSKELRVTPDEITQQPYIKSLFWINYFKIYEEQKYMLLNGK